MASVAMSLADVPYQIHSQPSGGHWIAWLTAVNEKTPAGAGIVVGQTQQEAESHAQDWAARLNDDPRLRRS